MDVAAPKFGQNVQGRLLTIVGQTTNNAFCIQERGLFEQSPGQAFRVKQTDQWFSGYSNSLSEPSTTVAQTLLEPGRIKDSLG